MDTVGCMPLLIDQVHFLVREIAPLLGGTYSDPRAVYPHVAYADIVLPDNQGTVHIKEADGKLHVSGAWPTENGTRHGAQITPSRYPSPGEPVYSTINVSPSKSPAQIANDIKRRFLPNYTACYAGCVQRQQSGMAHEAGVAKLAGELLTVVGGASNRSGNVIHLPSSAKRGYGTVQVHGPNSAQIEFRDLSSEMAKALIDTYLEMQAKAPSKHEEVIRG